MTRGKRIRFGWHGRLAALVTLLPGLAQAHSAVAGLGAIRVGLLHPLVTPAHIVLLLGLGLWLGQQRPLALRRPMLVFMSFAGMGLVASNWLALPAQWQTAVFLLALVSTLLVASGRRYVPMAGLTLLGASGLLIGIDSGVDSPAATVSVVSTLLATWFSLGVCLVNIAFYTSMCPPRRWAQIAIRVLAAWIAAVCILLLAFAVRASHVF